MKYSVGKQKDAEVSLGRQGQKNIQGVAIAAGTILSFMFMFNIMFTHYIYVTYFIIWELFFLQFPSEDCTPRSTPGERGASWHNLILS